VCRWILLCGPGVGEHEWPLYMAIYLVRFSSFYFFLGIRN
jgi:hypothetical protein